MYKVTIKVNGKDIYLTDFPTQDHHQYFAWDPEIT